MRLWLYTAMASQTYYVLYNINKFISPINTD